MIVFLFFRICKFDNWVIIWVFLIISVGLIIGIEVVLSILVEIKLYGVVIILWGFVCVVIVLMFVRLDSWFFWILNCLIFIIFVVLCDCWILILFIVYFELCFGFLVLRNFVCRVFILDFRFFNFLFLKFICVLFV